MAMYNEITVTAELTNTEYMITKNYNLLENKPRINSVELVGNKSLEDLGINPDAEENIIDTVKVNGSALVPDANKAVDVTVTTGTNNGTVKVNGSDVAVKGLKSAAFTEATAYDAAGSAAEVQGNVDALTVVVNGKVDKVQGKGLSQNDFTNAYKSKLDGIEAGAQVNTVTSVAGKTGAVNLSKSDVGLGNVDNTSDLNKPISTATQTALNGKVDKEAGKGLSTNDYTTADKTKLAGIEAEANKTIVDSAISGVSTNPVQNKVIYDLINNLLPEATASGNPISIDNASGFNAKSAKVTMLPIQSGSGDPSPTNIRPISGRNSVVLTQSGKNLVNWNVARYANNPLVTTLIRGTYTLSQSVYDAMGNWYIRAKKSDNSYCSRDELGLSGWLTSSTEGLYYGDSNLQSFTFTVPENGVEIRIGTQSAPASTIPAQLEVGSSMTAYEPFVSLTTYTATFPSTVYGGEYEFAESELTENMGIVDLGSLTWIYNTSFTNPIFYAALPSKVNNRANTGLCSCYPVNPVNATGAQNASSLLNDNEIALSINTGSYHLFIRDESYTSAESLTEFLNGKTLVYELATPTETTLTPETIVLLKGNNTLWTDGDNAEVKYSVSLDSLLPT